MICISRVSTYEQDIQRRKEEENALNVYMSKCVAVCKARMSANLGSNRSIVSGIQHVSDARIFYDVSVAA